VTTRATTPPARHRTTTPGHADAPPTGHAPKAAPTRALTGPTETGAHARRSAAATAGPPNTATRPSHAAARPGDRP
jgi:hypothetical protein